jgi:hypothetical protein
MAGVQGTDVAAAGVVLVGVVVVVDVAGLHRSSTCDGELLSAASEG